MTSRICCFVFVFAAIFLSFTAESQAQACTSQAGCAAAGYSEPNIITCATENCAGIFTGGSVCVVGSTNSDTILIFGGGGHFVCGNDGSDTIQFVSGTSGNFVWGGNGGDNITGGAYNDFIFGEAGNDTILGGGGSDFLSGGLGDDNISGQAGQDTINGDDGADILSGGSDADTLNGGEGNDQLNGNSGLDTLNGNDGNDTLLSDGNSDGDEYNGGAGDDRIFADDGANAINAGAGNDYVEAGDGDDTISGGDGYDQLFGEAGNDNITGDSEPDVIDGGAGTDVLDGGTELDTCLNGETNLNCENLTAARLLASVAYPHDGGTVIEWQTLFEAGTSGFELRVREGDKWRSLHRGLLAADVAGYAGARYAYFLPAWDSQAEYEIREIDVTGVRRSLGNVYATGLSQVPLAGLNANLRFVSQSIEVDQSWALAPLERSGRRLLAGAPTQAKVGVTSEGLQRVPLASLAAELGISEADLGQRADSGELSINLGDEAIGWRRVGDDIVFIGSASQSPYSAEMIYRVALGEGAPAASVNLAPSAGAAALTDYRATSVFELDKFAARVVPIDPAADTWFSHALSPTTPGKKDATVNVELSGYAGGEGVVRVELQGASLDPEVAIEHVFEIEVNGSVVGEASLADFERKTFELAVPAANLNEGANAVKVKTTLRGSEASIVYLDSVEIDYASKFVARDDALSFVANADGTVRIPGFSGSNVVVFEQDSEGAVRVAEGVETDGVGDGFEAAFSVQGGSRYWVSASSAQLQPWADSALALQDVVGGADYLVIARADLMATAEKLASLRREQGFSTLVVDIDDVYDSYSQSQPTPEAIRAFLKDAHESWSLKPRYVVLAGASHFDYRNRLGFGTPLVPAYQVQLHNGIVSSDVPMVDFDDDGVPEIAIGRLPAASDDELKQIVDKIVAYESLRDPSWADAVTLVADENDGSSNFSGDLEAFADALPGHIKSTKIVFGDMDADTMRTEISATVQAGTSWVHYLGHGGLAQWSRGTGILEATDVDGWAARQSQPFVSAGTCLTGAYDFPGVRSLGEAWIGSQGGAIGVWGATASTIHSESDLYAKHLRTAIADEGRLRVGDAIAHASSAHAAEATQFGLDTRRAYTVLGDPATVLRIAHPNPNVEQPTGEGVNVSQLVRPIEAAYAPDGNQQQPGFLDDDGCSVSTDLPNSPVLVLLLAVGALARRRRRA